MCMTVTAHGPGWAGLGKPKQEEAEKFFGNNVKVLKPPASGAPEVCQNTELRAPPPASGSESNKVPGDAAGAGPHRVESQR